MNEKKIKSFSWKKKVIIFLFILVILSLFPIFKCKDISYGWIEPIEGYSNSIELQNRSLLDLILGGFLYSCNNYYFILLLLIVAIILSFLFERILRRKK